MKLSAYHYKCIERWIKRAGEKDRKCPFGNENFNAGTQEDGEVCRAMFPALEDMAFPGIKICMTVCPCTVYSLGHVMRQAKEVVRENSS
ncbi:MAG: hypothetical protein ACYS1A_19350 [Planctomycetota bacterium]|jgi:hypothetical protein